MATSLTSASTVPPPATTAAAAAAAAAAAEAVDVRTAPAESQHEESFFTRLLSFFNFAKGKGFNSGY